MILSDKRGLAEPIVALLTAIAFILLVILWLTIFIHVRSSLELTPDLRGYIESVEEHYNKTKPEWNCTIYLTLRNEGRVSTVVLNLYLPDVPRGNVISITINSAGNGFYQDSSVSVTVSSSPATNCLRSGSTIRMKIFLESTTDLISSNEVYQVVILTDKAIGVFNFRT